MEVVAEVVEVEDVVGTNVVDVVDPVVALRTKLVVSELVDPAVVVAVAVSLV